MAEPGRQYASDYEKCDWCLYLRPAKTLEEVTITVVRGGIETKRVERQCKDRNWCAKEGCPF